MMKKEEKTEHKYINMESYINLVKYNIGVVHQIIKHHSGVEQTAIKNRVGVERQIIKITEGGYLNMNQMDEKTEEKLKEKGWVKIKEGLFVDTSDKDDSYGRLLKHRSEGNSEDNLYCELR